MNTQAPQTTPEEKRQSIQDRIAQTTQRIGAINQEYQAARRTPDTGAMQALIVEATALQDALPVLQCQAVEAEIAVMEGQRADAERRREELRGPMVAADQLYRQAEQAAGAALASFRQAEEEEQSLRVRLDNVRRQLAQMQAEAAHKSWRP